MQPALDPAAIRSHLTERRSRLQAAINELDQADDLVRLLNRVDDALSRLDGGSYGLCEVCGTNVTDEDLAANPLASYCFCELTPERQRALEHDLELAWRVQAALLPEPQLRVSGWQAHYRYLPYGPVSGDYCDLIAKPSASGAVYFMLGDVSGKGVAASLLMAHLNAAFRAFVPAEPAPVELVKRANDLLIASTLPSHFATLVCGLAAADGAVEIVNAGHCPPMVLRSGGAVEVVAARGIPLGLKSSSSAERYSSERLHLAQGDTLFLYTDGLTEAENAHTGDYGVDRLSSVLTRNCHRNPQHLIADCLADLASFVGDAGRRDDLTILAIRREESDFGERAHRK